jgi:4-aminobutyrate aminotransferase
LQIIEEEGLVERSAELGRYALERLRAFAEKTPAVGDVRGRGVMFGVDLVTDRETKEPARQLAEEVFYRCLDEGLSFKISAGSVLTLSPPMTISLEDLDRALTIVEEATVTASGD